MIPMSEKQRELLADACRANGLPAPDAGITLAAWADTVRDLLPRISILGFDAAAGNARDLLPRIIIDALHHLEAGDYPKLKDAMRQAQELVTRARVGDMPERWRG